MTGYQNTWGTYLWRPNHGVEFFHPDERQGDWRDFVQRYYEKVFFCSGCTEDGYLILHDSENNYRVKPDIYHIRPTPTFNYGDSVREKAEPERTGVVYFIGWHFKYEREYYLLNLNGKRSSKRVFSDDLQYTALSG